MGMGKERNEHRAIIVNEFNVSKHYFNHPGVGKLFHHHKYEKYSILVKSKITLSHKYEVWVRLINPRGIGVAEVLLF
jgi:hypothetical protein